jgi:betaine-aldehyde dehydrogenase
VSTKGSAATALRSFDRLFIGGDWVSPVSDLMIESISPLTGEVLARVPAAGPADVDAAVRAARVAFDDGPWTAWSPHQRAAAIMRLHGAIGDRLSSLVHAFTAEIGCPSALAEVFLRKAMTVLSESARLAETFAFEEERDLESGASVRLVREAVGVVGAIIPWNGPVTSACLKLGPALAAGCTVVLKPAPEGIVGVQLLCEAVQAAGFPPGVVNVTPGDREIGEYLVTHPGIDKIAFTGSTAAGRRIMSLCAERIRNVSLELGGKSAAIIVGDVSLDEIMPTLVSAIMANSGQVCAAISRVLIQRTRQEELVAALKSELATWTVGDPSNPQIRLGPLAAERQRDRVEEYIRAGLAAGAHLVHGGGRPAGLERGWFVEPTIFADVDSSMKIAQEEIFGPVLSIIPYDTVDAAVSIANDSLYGLSGAVFADDRTEAELIARRLRTGQVSVNSWNVCLTQPFGGYKQSGLGREGGLEGLEGYLEIKLLQGV